MGYFNLSAEEIRELLNNAYLIKRDGKCLECDGTGYFNWDENGEDVKTGYYDGNKRECGECEKCNGVGYLF